MRTRLIVLLITSPAHAQTSLPGQPHPLSQAWLDVLSAKRLQHNGKESPLKRG